jgi:hypothetical protein
MVKAEKLGRTYFNVRIKVLRGIHISRNVLFVHSLELQFSATQIHIYPNLRRFIFQKLFLEVFQINIYVQTIWLKSFFRLALNFCIETQRFLTKTELLTCWESETHLLEVRCM